MIHNWLYCLFDFGRNEHISISNRLHYFAIDIERGQLYYGERWFIRLGILNKVCPWWIESSGCWSALSSRRGWGTWIESTTTPSYISDSLNRHRSKSKYEYLIAKCDDLYVSSDWIWEKNICRVHVIHMYIRWGVTGRTKVTRSHRESSRVE